MRFLFVDQILELNRGEYVRGIKHITPDDACLGRDEQGRAIFPSSLIGETLGQLAAWNVMYQNDFHKRPVAGIVSCATVHRPAYLGETLELESFIDCLDDSAVQYHSIAQINGEKVFEVEGALGPLVPMPDFIDDDEVRRQFAEIYRPVSEEEKVPVVSAAPILNADRTVPCYVFSFDRILQVEPGVSLLAEKRISRSAPYFADHFPNNPVLPMTVLLECKLDLARQFLAQAAFPVNYQFSSMRKIKMNEFVHPGAQLVCHVAVKKRDEKECVLTFRSEVNGKRVCVLEMLLRVEGV